jgi:hypothetical protein
MSESANVPKEVVEEEVRVHLAGLTSEQVKALRIRFKLDAPDLDASAEERALRELAKELAALEKTKKH